MTTVTFHFDPDQPCRGGKTHLGIYLGGAPLTDTYHLSSEYEPYQCALQLRTEKSLLAIESAIRTMGTDSKTLKFNGKLEIKDSAAEELDKEALLLTINDLVRGYGFQTFFYLPGKDGSMKYLIDEPYFFSVNDVLNDHKSQLSEPDPVLLDDTDLTSETQESVRDCFRCYDLFERFDISILRRVVQALISKPLQDKVRIKFGHDPHFCSYPGSVYLSMVLDVCNTSSSLDISSATTEFSKLSLSSYPAENINDFVTEAQRLIKIMSMGYALPYKTGSLLLSKVDKTESTYFNQKVHTWQTVVKAMERKVGPNQDPKLLQSHSDYATHNPLKLCAMLQTEYGQLLESDKWPAAASKVPQPEGNAAFDLSPRRCFKCGSPNHLANDPACPHNSLTGGGDKGHSLSEKNGGGGALLQLTRPIM